MYTIKEAEENLGVSTMTLWRYMKRFGIEPSVDEYDRRIKNISQEQYDVLKSAMRHIYKRRERKQQ